MGLATPKNLLRYPEDLLSYPDELGSAEESYRGHGQCSPQELRAVSQGLLESFALSQGLLESFALRPRRLREPAHHLRWTRFRWPERRRGSQPYAKRSSSSRLPFCSLRWFGSN